MLRIVRSRPYGPCLFANAHSVQTASNVVLKAGKPCGLPLLTSLPSWLSWPSCSSSSWLSSVLLPHHHQLLPSSSSISSPSSPSWLSLPSSSLLSWPSHVLCVHTT